MEGLVGDLVEPLGYKYEALKLSYHIDEFRNYIPDFVNENVIIESKGRFTLFDRQKMLRVRADHPNRRILMVFGRAANKIYKGSSTTYGEWCTKHDIDWIDIVDFQKEPQKVCKLLTTKKRIFGSL